MAQRKKASISNYLKEDPTPGPGQVIARVLAPRGGNLHQVEYPDGTVTLAELPPKYRNVIWVKRDSYVIVQPFLNQPDKCKIGAEICTVLHAQHVIDLRKLDLFPTRWSPPIDQTDSVSDLDINPNGPCRAYDSSSDEGDA